uniref:Uncharacterized protein n=1 Tax=Anopheles albimanus TaxID=7167 RepID=A0A182FD17_ANOAL
VFLALFPVANFALNGCFFGDNLANLYQVQSKSKQWPSRRITPTTTRTRRRTRTASRSRSVSDMNPPVVCARSSCATSVSRRRVTCRTRSS